MTDESKTARSPGGVFAVSCHAPAAEAEPRQAAGGCERSDIVTVAITDDRIYRAIAKWQAECHGPKVVAQ